VPETALTVVLRARTTTRWPRLVACVRAVEAQGPAVAQLVLVVDDPAVLAAALQEWGGRHDVVPVHTSAHATAFNAPVTTVSARDAGLAHARHGVVAFLDGSVEPVAGWAAAHLAAYDDPSVAGAGGPVLAEWGDRSPAGFPAEFAWTLGCTATGGPAAWQPVRTLNGANLSIRRDVLDAVGGFGPGPGAAGLCRRILEAKPDLVLVHDPGAAARRLVEHRRAGAVPFLRRCWTEGDRIARRRAEGSGDALAAACDQAMRVLSGITGHDGITRPDGGLGRAARVIAGFGVGSTGYGAGRARFAIGHGIGLRKGPLA
jgi:hypothetical protein